MTTDEAIIDAERAVVGECIFAPTSVRAASGLVSPADFADPRLGATFALICGMVSSGGPEAVTALTIRMEINRRKAEDRAATGASRVRTVWPDDGMLGDLVTHGIAGRVEHHARIIREAAVGRALSLLGRQIAQAAESGNDPAILAAKAVEDAKAIRDGARTSGLPLRLLAEVLADDSLDGYDWAIPGLLERGDRLIVTGGEGKGKTTLMRQLALCAAAGIQPFKAERFQPVNVMVIDAENSERQWHRKAGWVNHAVKQRSGVNPAERIHLACVPRQDITTPKHLGDIHAAIDEHQPDVILIGPLYKMIPQAINNDSDAAPLIAALDSIRERGAALIMEAHAGHALGKGGDRDFRPRGSSALLGWPEFGFGLSPDPDDATRVNVIRWRGDRDERDWPPRLRQGGVMPWTDDRLPWGTGLGRAS